MATNQNLKNVTKISLNDEMKTLTEPYKPKKLAVLNERAWVELALHKGPFPYGNHYHETDDELFICVKGTVTIELGDDSVKLVEGEMLHVKAGQIHMPNAEDDCYLIRLKTSKHMDAVLDDGTVISNKKKNN